MSRPFQTIWPPVGFTRPMMILARVVLPPPLGPVNTTSRWSSMVREMSFRIPSSLSPSRTA